MLMFAKIKYGLRKAGRRLLSAPKLMKVSDVTKKPIFSEYIVGFQFTFFPSVSSICLLGHCKIVISIFTFTETVQFFAQKTFFFLCHMCA